MLWIALLDVKVSWTKAGQGKKFMLLELLGFDRYMVVPGFFPYFFKIGLLYHILNISFLLSSSVASGK